MRNDDETETDPGEIIRYGIIAEVDLAARRVVVDTGDVRTAPIRWVSGRAGSTTIWSPPSPGEQVVLLCPDGDIEGAIVLSGVEADAFPLHGDSLREGIRFADGAEISYDPESHALEAKLPAGATAKVVATGGLTLDCSDGGLTIKGDVSIEGELQATGDIGSDADVVAGTVSLKDHKHTGVTTGGGISGKPLA